MVTRSEEIEWGGKSVMLPPHKLSWHRYCLGSQLYPWRFGVSRQRLYSWRGVVPLGGAIIVYYDIIPEVLTVPRRDLTGGWGESRVVTVRLSPADARLLAVLTEVWDLTPSKVLRRALRDAAGRELNPRQERAPERSHNAPQE